MSFCNNWQYGIDLYASQQIGWPASELLHASKNKTLEYEYLLNLICLRQMYHSQCIIIKAITLICKAAVIDTYRFLNKLKLKTASIQQYVTLIK